jgi:hypothetical protein
MLNETTNMQSNADLARLAERADLSVDPAFRAAYMAHHLRAFLADQIRALRGDLSQREFGLLIDKPQSVVSRLEGENYGKHTLQTLLDIATKLDIGLLVRFVDFATFLRTTNDLSEEALHPSPYDAAAISSMLSGQTPQEKPSKALAAFLSTSYDQRPLRAAANSANAGVSGALAALSEPQSEQLVSKVVQVENGLAEAAA